LRRGALVCRYRFADDMDAVLKLLEKYADVPMSFADGCLVRMTETLNNPMLLTTDSDFRLYRRHGRQIIPCVLPR
jgi:predicted nucleic acid-binding protein